MMPNQPSILIIDGHAVIFRSWHAIREKFTTSSGIPITGVMGFFNTLFKIIKRYRPEYIATTFDTRGPTFRKKMFPQYKAHRPPVDPELIAQIPMVKEVLQVLKIPFYELDEYEADDVVGTLSVAATAQKMRVFILTCDSDHLQLVNENAVVLMYSGFGNGGIKLYDRQAVSEKFEGLGPEYVTQIKALSGDKSDNIPGVPGIGNKTAIALLKAFGSLDEIYNEPKKILELKGLRGAKRICGLLQEHQESAYNSLKLAQIVTDAPVDYNLEDAKFGDYDEGLVREVLFKYEFRILASELAKLSVTGQHADSDSSIAPVSTKQQRSEKLDLFSDLPEQDAGDADEKGVCRIEYSIVATKEKLDDLMQTLVKAKSFVFEPITMGTDPLKSRLIGISFAVAKGYGWYLPLQHKEGAQLDFASTLSSLSSIFSGAEISKIAHNANYAVMSLATSGIEIAGLSFDTMIAAALCNYRQVGLQQLAFGLFNEELQSLSDLTGPTRNLLAIDQVAIAKMATYAATNVALILRLHTHLIKVLDSKEQAKVFHDIEMPLLPVITAMQRDGFRLDHEVLSKMSTTLAEELAMVDSELQRTVLYSLPDVSDFNINSNKQLGHLLFDRFGAPHGRKIKTGWSVDESTLARLLQKEGLDDRVYNLVNCALRHRNLNKLKTTYVDALPKLVNPDTNRIHTTFNQVGSSTGRLASTNPNIQNIPIRTSLGREVRSAFCADSANGWSLLSADYSQIELRILAHLSGEEDLIAAFQHGEDVHASTARTMYGVETVTPEQRRIAKILNFGVIYGLGANGIARQTDLSRHQGKEFIELYFGKYPGINDFIAERKKQASVDGYVQTLAGRRRYLPDLQSKNPGLRAAAERFAINMPIQGTAADIIKIAMINIQKAIRAEKLASKMLVQVHDELVFEVAPGEKDVLVETVVDLMVAAADLRVPMEVSIKHGDRWGAMS